MDAFPRDRWEWISEHTPLLWAPTVLIMIEESNFPLYSNCDGVAVTKYITEQAQSNKNIWDVIAASTLQTLVYLPFTEISKMGKRPKNIVSFLLCYCCKKSRRHLFVVTEYGKMRHLPFIVNVLVLWPLPSRLDIFSMNVFWRTFIIIWEIVSEKIRPVWQK